jgi:hypothetical protein
MTGWMGRSRTPGLSLTQLIGCVVAAATVIALGATPVSASPSATATTSAAVAQVAPAAKAAALPWLPKRCQDQTTSVICRITHFPRRPWLVLWGDSHALEYLPAVRHAARTREFNLVIVFSGGCPLTLPFPASSGEPRLTCDVHNARALKYMRKLAVPGRRIRAVLGSWWDIYRQHYAQIQHEEATGADAGLSYYERHIARLAVERSRAMFRAIGRAGIAADVLAESGTVPDNAPDCPAGNDPYLCDLSRKSVLPRAKDNRIWLRELSTALAGRPRVIDPSPTYCGPDICYGRVDGINTFYNVAHLDPRLTRTMGRYFRPTVDALLTKH